MYTLISCAPSKGRNKPAIEAGDGWSWARAKCEPGRALICTAVGNK